MIKEKIVSKVKEYCHTVHTQDRQEVMALWNEKRIKNTPRCVSIAEFFSFQLFEIDLQIP